MTPCFELAEFTVRDGEEDAFIAERPAMIGALQQAFPGALAAWLTKRDDGTWVDVVLWRSREDAEDATERVNSVPEAHEWFRHISESHGLRHIEVVHEHLFSFIRTDQ
jgi:Antibiotic biosynthesis monooxygenase